MIFDILNSNDINYIVWKDIYNVKEFFSGDSELDILLDFDHKKKFEQILFSNGFVSLQVYSPLEKGIEHYIKYSNGKYFHLHVYYNLITGNHFVKEFEFPFRNHYSIVISY